MSLPAAVEKETIGDSTQLGAFGSLAVVGLSTLTGTVTCQGPLNVAGQVNYPATMSTQCTTTSLSATTGGSGIPGNVFRIRSSDAATTGVRISLGNTGAGTSTLYDSRLSLYCLNTTETNTNNEKLVVGINSGGGYINNVVSGTGAMRPLGIYNNTLAITTGNVTCNGALTVPSGSVTITAPNQPNLMVVGTGAMGPGKQAGLVMGSYAYGNNPNLQFGAQGDGNFGDDFLVLQKPSGNAGNNAAALRMIIKAANGNVGFGGQGAPATAVDVVGTIKASTSVNLPNCASFTGRYSELALPAISTLYNGPTSFTNAILWQATANTVNNGTVTFYPTSTGTATGTAIFSTIVCASANPWNNTTSAIAVQFVGGKTISADLRTVVFNVVQGTNLALGGATTTFAPANIPVMCAIIGF